MTDRRGVKYKLSGAERAQIAELVKKGASDEDIAGAYGVHRTTILRLRHEFDSESAISAEPESGTLLHYLWRIEQEREMLSGTNPQWHRLFEFRAKYEH
jgi:transposase-like protein